MRKTTPLFNKTIIDDLFSKNPSYASLLKLNASHFRFDDIKETLVDTQKRKELNDSNRKTGSHPMNSLIDSAFEKIGTPYTSTRTDTYDIWQGKTEGFVKIPYHLSTSLTKGFKPIEHSDKDDEKLFRTILLGEKDDKVIIPQNTGGFSDDFYMLDEENEIVHPRNQEYEILGKDGNTYFVRYKK